MRAPSYISFWEMIVFFWNFFGWILWWFTRIQSRGFWIFGLDSEKIKNKICEQKKKNEKSWNFEKMKLKIRLEYSDKPRVLSSKFFFFKSLYKSFCGLYAYVQGICKVFLIPFFASGKQWSPHDTPNNMNISREPGKTWFFDDFP